LFYDFKRFAENSRKREVLRFCLKMLFVFVFPLKRSNLIVGLAKNKSLWKAHGTSAAISSANVLRIALFDREKNIYFKCMLNYMRV